MTAGVAAVAACGSQKPGEVAKDGSVTVKHIFGETKVPAPPKRVVSAGFTEQDDLLAVGVVPIAVTNWWGDQPFGVWPWALPKLGPAQPEVLSLADGIQVDRIAALKPDLIVATNAGVDQDTYNKLTEIAPTIPQSGQDAFFEPWKDQAATIGQAVFKFDEMAALVKGVDDKFTAAGTNNPQFSGKKVLLLQGTLVDDSAVATMAGWRTDFLTQMGFDRPGQHQRLRPRSPRLHPSRSDGVGARRRRRARLDDRIRRRSGPSHRRSDLQAAEGDGRRTQRLHRQGPGRCHRVLVAAVLPGGGRPTATRLGQSARLTV